MKLLYSQPHQQPYSVKVVKIDSTKDYMLIYAVSNERKFKIVSRKVENDCKIESNPLYWLSARGKREKKFKRSRKNHHYNSDFY